MSEQTLIGVQFRSVGKSYHFFLPEDFAVELGDFVIVNTARGKQIGKVTQKGIPVPENTQDIQSVERLATSKDLLLKDMIKQKEAEAVEKTRQFLEGNEIYAGVKILDAEYSFDSSRLTLFLSYDNVPDFNMRNFIREAAPMFDETRVEIRQVGPRDMAKELSGLGACGIEKRCCSSFLTEFSSISIRMAKSQNVSLTPTEITGICGRLRCCMAFEHEMYEEARKLLPKRKKVIPTPLGEGKVVQVLPLNDSVIVDIPEVGPREITRTELETGKMAEKNPIIPLDDPRLEEHEEDIEVISLSTEKLPAEKEINQKNKGKSRGERNRPGTHRDKLPRFHDEDPDQHQAGSAPHPKAQGKPRPTGRRDRRQHKPGNQTKANGKQST